MKPLPPHYTTIEDMPILAWIKLHEQKSMVHLLIRPKKLDKEQIQALIKVWESIYEEYIVAFGFDENLMRIHLKEKERAKLQREMIVTGDESIMNFIKRKDTEIEKAKGMGKKGDIYKTKIAIEKFMGFQIKLRETSVKDFYTYQNELSKKPKK